MFLIIVCNEVLFGQVVDTASNNANLLSKVSSIFYSGNISLGTQYGLLPYSREISPPQTNVVLNGNMGMAIWKVPIQASFNFSSLGYLSGINNYFRISFDANQYRKNLAAKKGKFESNFDVNIDSLFQIKSKLRQKLAYVNYKQAFDSINRKIEIDSSLVDSFSDWDLPSYETDYNFSGDSLTKKKEMIQNNLIKVDRLISAYEKLKLINSPNLDVDSLKGKKINNPLQKIKNFQIGMCYPSYATFLVADVPVNGISSELQISNLYVAFTYGKTVSNFYDFTNTANLSQSSTQQNNGPFAILGFPQNANGKTIGVIKTGYGTPEGSHVFIGALMGFTGPGYSFNSQRNIGETYNYVGEIDARFSITKNHNVDLIYGRSKNVDSNPELQNEKQSIFDFSNPISSHAILLKYSGVLDRLGTRYSMSYRYIQPFFESYGTGFLKSDNERMEMNLQQRVSKKLKLGGLIRYQKDDVLDLLKVNNTLLSYGLNASFKPNRRWMLKAVYKPFELKSKYHGKDSYDSKNKVLTGLISYNKRKAQKTTMLTGVILHYRLNDGVVSRNFSNANITLTKTLSEKWQIEGSSSYFFSNDTTENAKELIADLKAAYKSKKLLLSTSLRNSITLSNYDYNYGLKLSARYNLFKKLMANASVEKVLLGAFYKNIGYNNYENSNYRLSASLSMRW